MGAAAPWHFVLRTASEQAAGGQGRRRLPTACLLRAALAGDGQRRTSEPLTSPAPSAARLGSFRSLGLTEEKCLSLFQLGSLREAVFGWQRLGLMGIYLKAIVPLQPERWRQICLSGPV